MSPTKQATVNNALKRNTTQELCNSILHIMFTLAHTHQMVKRELISKQPDPYDLQRTLH